MSSVLCKKNHKDEKHEGSPRFHLVCAGYPPRHSGPDNGGMPAALILGYADFSLQLGSGFQYVSAGSLSAWGSLSADLLFVSTRLRLSLYQIIGKYRKLVNRPRAGTAVYE